MPMPNNNGMERDAAKCSRARSQCNILTYNFGMNWRAVALHLIGTKLTDHNAAARACVQLHARSQVGTIKYLITRNLFIEQLSR